MKTADVLRALALAKSSLGPNDSAMQVLAHFCFMDDIVYAYNDVTAVVVEEPTGLNCALHGETLMGVLAVAGADEIKIKLANGAAAIDVGNGSVKVPVLPPADFIFELPDDDPVVTLPFTDGIARGFERCLMSISSDTLKPEFSGVTVQVNKDSVVFYSTDNVSATRYVPEGKFVSRKTLAAVIPAIACEQMLKLRGDGAKLQLGERAGIMTVGKVTLVTKLLPAKVEQFEKIFAAHSGDKSFFNLPAELGREIAKASVLLGREQVKECVLEFGKGKVVVVAAGLLGSMKTTVTTGAKDVGGVVASAPELVARILPHVKMLAVNDKSSLVFSGDSLTHIISCSSGVNAAPAPAPEQTAGAAPPPKKKDGIEDLEDDIPF